MLADQQQMILRQLLEDGTNDADNEATIKAKRFYKSCMNISEYWAESRRLRDTKQFQFYFICTAQIRQHAEQPLKALLKSLGGWPVLEKNWSPPNQTIERLLGKLRGEFNEHFIVSILVGPDDKNSSVNILQVNMARKLPRRFISDSLSYTR